ncbi:MAG: hypothetical protein HOY71_52170, partial [Nonomuraea sp.]|nr:hypothetical protein [Nonomuraea sp.]
MEQSAEGPVQGRRTAGRHAARRGEARAERPAADLETERGLEDGGRVGRRRHGRRRARTRNARLVAGAAVLAGGVAVLIGTNGTFGGVLTASGAPARSADVVRQAGADDTGNVPANPGRAPTGAKGASEAREVRKGEARDDAPATDRPSAQPSSGKAGRPATPQTTAEPG